VQLPQTREIDRTTDTEDICFSKIVLGAFILWASLGVGELFDKIGMMLK